jgi:hypothetical protein
LLLLTLCAPHARAADVPPHVTRRLAGRLVDHTNNYGADRRIWSAALGERRDLYVYLPPGFDPCRQYPVLIWMHGINSDESAFLEDALPIFDAAIAAGRLPPLIIAAPDGSWRGRPGYLGPNPIFLNSDLGPFEDYLAQDVWGFVLTHYPIRPEREAHVLAGYSGGGAAAFRIAIKYRETFAVAIALLAPLNTRWLDCHGRYQGKFDPNCWGWRESVDRGHEVLGRFYGIFAVRVRRLVYPLYGRGPDAVARLSSENPIEMIDSYGLQPGQLSLYVAYAGRDQFNLDAQAESFLYRAHERGLEVGVGYDPRGRHDWKAGRKLLPGALDWLAPLLAPCATPACPALPGRGPLPAMPPPG